MKTRSVFLTTLLAVAALSALPLAAQAQSVNQRLHNQSKRIANGVKNGELTRNQIDRLKSRDAGIRARELNDKSHNDGRLTSKERQNLNRSLNRNSRAIYRDKHDAASKGN